MGLKAYEKAETFIDRYSSSFEEYLSSVVNKLRDTNSEYNNIESNPIIYRSIQKYNLISNSLSRLYKLKGNLLICDRLPFDFSFICCIQR